MQEAPPLIKADLDHIMAHTEDLWEELRGRAVFLTGGTGFFGKWLTATFCEACDRFDLRAHVCIPTRDPGRAMAEAPWLYSHPAVRLLPGDLQWCEFPDGRFPYFIHAMTANKAGGRNPNSRQLFDENILVTRRVLDFAAHADVKRFLNISSGSTYGPQPPSLAAIPDGFSTAPDTTRSDLAYGHSKHASEFLIFRHAVEYGYAAVTARCFAFVGPFLPLSANYAIGNFIRDALKGGPIRINSDGTAVRSYLYTADLAIWLWMLLLRGRTGQAYNVGSDIAISIGGLAQLVAGIVTPRAEVAFASQPSSGQPGARYVPSISRARKELGLVPWIELPTAIERTAAWYRKALS